MSRLPYLRHDELGPDGQEVWSRVVGSREGDLVNSDGGLVGRTVQQFLGDQGLVEFVALCGYYTLISFLLNGFAVPLPPGAQPRWGDSGAGGTSAAS